VYPYYLNYLAMRQVVNIISNTFNGGSHISTGSYTSYNTQLFNKWVQALAEIRKLQEEKSALYEKMIKDREEMMEELKKLVTAPPLRSRTS
jgi:hypothetical protein